jgi:hypothetical protein
LSDAGFLVVVVAGAIVAVGAGAAGVDGVAAVVLGSVVDMGHLPFCFVNFELGTLTVLPPDRHSGDAILEEKLP